MVSNMSQIGYRTNLSSPPIIHKPFPVPWFQRAMYIDVLGMLLLMQPKVPGEPSAHLRGSKGRLPPTMPPTHHPDPSGGRHWQNSETGWWFEPLWKNISQFGLLFPIYMEK
jgi:hypothetical protein